MNHLKSDPLDRRYYLPVDAA